MRKHLKQAGAPALSVALTCFFPCAFLFFRNAGEARAADMLPFFGIFLLTAAAIFLPLALILRNVSRAALVTDLAMPVVIYCTAVCRAVKELLPWFRDLMFLIPAAALLLALTAVLARKKPNMTVLCGLIAVMYAAMLAVSAAPAVPTLISAASYEKSDVQTDPALTVQTFSGEKRNFYYLIFDEYGGPENLLHYYDYDNQEFWDGLEERGFAVSQTSKNTESAWTVSIIPNMLNLQYVTGDDVPITSRLEWLEQPAIYELFRNNGYRINLVNHDSFLGESGCRVLTQRQAEETISVYLYENSIFCVIPGLKWVIEDHVLHRGQNGPRLALDNARDAMLSCWEAAREGPTLTICYLSAPHAPFLFDRTGRGTHPAEYYDWRRPELYLAKLEYITPAILETVDNIQRQDPEAVIVLQADHGARMPGQLVYYYGGPWFDTQAEIPYMENVLNAVYVPGGAPDIEGDSCINTLRRTINAVYGTDMAMLDVPPDYEIPAEYMPPEPEASNE